MLLRVLQGNLCARACAEFVASPAHLCSCCARVALGCLIVQLENTKRFLAVHNTVPAAITTDGKILRESMPMAYWVDEQHPKVNPLQPPSAEGVTEMKRLISKFTSGKYDIVGSMYQLLWEVDSVDRQKDLTSKLLASYAELSKDLQAHGGPYLMGSQFTLVDVALIPFVDRALVLLPHYKSFELPDTAAFQPLRAWRQAYQSRPSWKISSADRLQRSVAVQPFASVKRDEYICEVYSSYANGVKGQSRRRQRGNAQLQSQSGERAQSQSESWKRAEREREVSPWLPHPQVELASLTLLTPIWCVLVPCRCRHRSKAAPSRSPRCSHPRHR